MADEFGSSVFIITPPDQREPDPPWASKFYEAIGRFAVAWGSMDVHVEALLRMALNIEGKTDQPRIFQINLVRKIDQIKDICRDCKKLNGLEGRVRAFSPFYKELGQDRDFIIHSIHIGFETQPERAIVGLSTFGAAPLRFRSWPT